MFINKKNQHHQNTLGLPTHFWVQTQKSQLCNPKSSYIYFSPFSKMHITTSACGKHRPPEPPPLPGSLSVVQVTARACIQQEGWKLSQHCSHTSSFHSQLLGVTLSHFSGHSITILIPKCFSEEFWSLPLTQRQFNKATLTLGDSSLQFLVTWYIKLQLSRKDCVYLHVSNHSSSTSKISKVLHVSILLPFLDFC